MAQKPEQRNTDSDPEGILRISQALEKIARDEDLRYFLRALLTGMGHGLTPIGDGANHTYYLLGRHSIGSDLIATILEHQPQLYVTMIAEGLSYDKNEKQGKSYDDRE